MNWDSSDFFSPGKIPPPSLSFPFLSQWIVRFCLEGLDPSAPFGFCRLTPDLTQPLVTIQNYFCSSPTCWLVAEEVSALLGWRGFCPSGFPALQDAAAGEEDVTELHGEADPFSLPRFPYLERIQIWGAELGLLIVFSFLLGGDSGKIPLLFSS